MISEEKTYQQLLQEIDSLRSQLVEAEGALEAIRSGEVDALVIYAPGGEQIYTLQGAEHPYRIMVETMNEGAATVLEDGGIQYANSRLAELLKVPLETLVGSSLLDYIVEEDWDTFEGLVEQGLQGSGRAEIRFHSGNLASIPVLVSLSISQVDSVQALCLVATDLTEQKRNEEIVAAERLARSILDQAAEAIIVCDGGGKIIRANQATYRVTRQNPLFKPFESLFPLVHEEPCEGGRCFSLANVLAGVSFQGVEVQTRSRDGEKLFFLLSAAPLRNQLEQIIGCIITLTDITERKGMEERLSFQALLLDRVHDAIIATDEHSIVRAWNRAAEELYGWKAEEAVGRAIGELIRSEFSEEQRAEALRELDEKGFYQVELTQYTREGSQLVMEENTIAFRDASGKVTGYVSTSRNITERKRAEEALKTYSLQLERSNKELQDFASIASHDLQEPLRKVQGFGDRLKVKYAPSLSDEGREWIERMQNAAARMQVMLNDLLEYSRVTTKAQPFAFLDLNEVAAGVISDLEVRMDETQGQVEISSLPTLEADPLQMRRLFQNLVSNGLKFHEPGTAPRVRISAEHLQTPKRTEGEWVQIFVEDNGIGFEEKYLDLIFQPFQRLHGRSEYHGNGIGLAICRKIVERHGGALTAKSAPGKGARFVVTLPVRQAGK